MIEIKNRLINKLSKTEELMPILAGNRTLASVLILFIFIDDEWKIVYTKRTTSVNQHQGEVSFPGGGSEPGDKSLISTAKREAYEEIGIQSEDIEILGVMKPFETNSNYLVYPVVGIIQSNPRFVINAAEVERVFMIPVYWLMDKNNYSEKVFVTDTKNTRKTLFYRTFDGEQLWGLSARITKKIIELLQ